MPQSNRSSTFVVQKTIELEVEGEVEGGTREVEGRAREVGGGTRAKVENVLRREK